MKIAGCFTLAALALVAHATAVQAADLVVVEAGGIPIKEGTMIDPAKPLVLKPGQYVKLITSMGNILRFDGPYNRLPDIAPPPPVPGLRIPTTDPNGRVQNGADRGPEARVVELPEPWLLDVGASGPVCLREGLEPVFWRNDTRATTTFSVTPKTRDWKLQTPWQAGQDRVALPSDVVLRDNSEYVVSLDDTETDLTVNTVPASLANDLMRAAWMREKGCDAQATALSAIRK